MERERFDEACGAQKSAYELARHIRDIEDAQGDGPLHDAIPRAPEDARECWNTAPSGDGSARACAVEFLKALDKSGEWCDGWLDGIDDMDYDRLIELMYGVENGVMSMKHDLIREKRIMDAQNGKD